MQEKCEKTGLFSRHDLGISKQVINMVCQSGPKYTNDTPSFIARELRSQLRKSSDG